MVYVEVEILKIIDEHQPIWVECLLIDCNRTNHYFHEKLPVVSLNYSLEFPCKGGIRCKIVQENSDTYFIDTSSPDYVESLKGESIFEVYKSQIVN